jgi:broad specificity phosphatase PhoE
MTFEQKHTKYFKKNTSNFNGGQNEQPLLEKKIPNNVGPIVLILNNWVSNDFLQVTKESTDEERKNQTNPSIIRPPNLDLNLNSITLKNEITPINKEHDCFGRATDKCNELRNKKSLLVGNSNILDEKIESMDTWTDRKNEYIELNTMFDNGFKTIIQTSPFKKCKQTAAILQKIMPNIEDCTIDINNRLRETDYKAYIAYHGTSTYLDGIKRDPVNFDGIEINHCGESSNHFGCSPRKGPSYERFKKVWNDTLVDASNNQTNIILVSHDDAFISVMEKDLHFDLSEMSWIMHNVNNKKIVFSKGIEIDN